MNSVPICLPVPASRPSSMIIPYGALCDTAPAAAAFASLSCRPLALGAALKLKNDVLEIREGRSGSRFDLAVGVSRPGSRNSFRIPSWLILIAGLAARIIYYVRITAIYSPLFEYLCIPS